MAASKNATGTWPSAVQFSRCPLKYREALILFYFHEMDVPATAQSLGLPEGTFKARSVSREGDSARQTAATAGAAPR